MDGYGILTSIGQGVFRNSSVILHGALSTNAQHSWFAAKSPFSVNSMVFPSDFMIPKSFRNFKAFPKLVSPITLSNFSPNLSLNLLRFRFLHMKSSQVAHRIAYSFLSTFLMPAIGYLFLYMLRTYSLTEHVFWYS